MIRGRVNNMEHRVLIVEDNFAHMEALCKIIDDLKKNLI